MDVRHRMQGVTLLELMFGLFIVSVLLTIAVPAFDSVYDKQRLKGAAVRLAAETRQAREEADLLGRPVTVSITAGPAWCIGLSDTGTCDCGEPASCQLDGSPRAVEGSRFSGVLVKGADLETTFVPAYSPGQPAYEDWPVVLESAGGRSLGVRISMLGNTDLCTPAGSEDDWTYDGC